MLTASSRRFAADESGATAIEYGLIAALIAVGLHRRLHRSSAAASAALFGLRESMPAPATARWTTPS